MIIRRKHTGNFAVIPNSTANDMALRADALGVLVYLLAKPENWQVSIADLRKRFDMGRNRVYAILGELAEAGYVERIQNRSGEANHFTAVEYHVYDCPRGAGANKEVEREVEPLPQIGEPEKPQQIPASLFSASPVTVMRKSGNIIKTDLNKPLSEEKTASVEAGADAPSVTKMVWKEGRELLQASSSKPNSSIIGKWLKRTITEEAKHKLLDIIRAAARAGTGDPVGYVTAALSRETPTPLDPSTFDRAAWQRKVQAALKTKAWAPEWGPAPGQRGCKIPDDLISPDLLSAVSNAARRAA